MSRLRCPTCGRSFNSEQSEALPFCCDRCREIDLGRWLSEEMTLPLPPRIDEDEEFGEWPE